MSAKATYEEMELRIKELEKEALEHKQTEEALRESEAKYSTLVEKANDGVAIIQDEVFKFVNEAWSRITGYSTEEFSKMSILDVVAPEFKDLVMQRYKSRIKGEKSLSVYEIKVQCKDGTIRDVELAASIIQYEGRPAAMAILRDISERKRAEKALREERDKAQNYLDIAGVIIVAINAKGEVTLVNKKCCEVLGYKDNEIIGKDWFDNFLPERIRDEVKEVFGNLLAGETEPVEFFENPVLTKSGQEKIIAWHNTFLKDQTGNITGTLSSGNDVTEQKQAEEALRESEEKYRLLIENIPYVTWITSEHGKTTFISPNVEEIYGYSQEEIREGGGSLWFGRIHSDDVEIVRESFEMMFTRKQQFDVEYRIQRKDGEWIWVHDMAIMAFEKDNIRYAYGIFSDTTERKRAEEALLESESQLRSLAARLEEMEEAERKSLAQELHDRVGQNLSALNINLNIMSSQLSAESKANVAKRLGDSMVLVEEATEHIRDVMAELRPHVLDDYGLMAALRWYGERFSERTGISTEVRGKELTTRLPKGIETAFFRIAQEAMTNVAKHADASQVTVTLEEVIGLVRMSVADDGIGFDLTNLSPRERPGWGIITMKERAQTLGGTVSVESEPGKGTRVVVEVKM